MEIMGVKVDSVTYPQALEKARKFIESGGKHYIVTPNPEIIVTAQKDRQFKDILNKADLAVPDGIGLIFAARFLGKSLPERVTGVDLLEGLVALAAEHGYNLFILGGGEGVAGKAAVELKKRYSKLKIAGTFSGRAEEEFDKETRAAFAGKKIDILAVGYGAPKQERWIARNLPLLNVKLAIGVGGAFDFLAGEAPRAPQRIRQLGLEWLYRLVRQTWRLKRQLSLPYFVYLVLKARLKS